MKTLMLRAVALNINTISIKSTRETKAISGNSPPITLLNFDFLGCIINNWSSYEWARMSNILTTGCESVAGNTTFRAATFPFPSQGDGLIFSLKRPTKSNKDTATTVGGPSEFSTCTFESYSVAQCIISAKLWC
jgi:hypothetical protein